MSIKIGVGFGIPYAKGGANWTTFWASLISATVEDANPDQIVLTFPISASLTTADFTVTVNGANRAVSSLAWVGGVLTLTLASDVVVGDTVTVSLKGLTAEAVTNNVGSAEVKLYITGLTTPLSSGQRLLLDTLVKAWKTGQSITDMDDIDDCVYFFAGETVESSLKNIVKNANHATAVNGMETRFVQYEGFQGDGISMYIDSNYNPTNHGVKYTLNNAGQEVYLRTNKTENISLLQATNTWLGIKTTASTGYFRINSLGVTVAGIFATSLGYISANRLDASNLTIYQNKNLLASPTVAANAIPNANILIAGASAYSTHQISLICLGGSKNITNVGVRTDAFEAYMDAHGKGVIA